ncbi:hypothetical protein [Rheinheimera sp. MMS21-TC3]|uniref:amino acid kinase family protein n=1 Tax=Rheinheimera sp. MMS21-TC3 TaxID=3072790 RepID=UPI0028C44B6E|nr:hypothetical protein [Rheinheimera sp. MMS21-TC3]WNO60478.1 hypothetical protein RDV63_05790 [Rheinheimera sp. MMS21-TC3]
MLNTIKREENSENRNVVAQVHKFGGSSLANASRFHAVLELILQQDSNQPIWVVVSAPGDCTDDLLAIIEQPNDADRLIAILALQQKLTRLIIGCLPAKIAANCNLKIKAWLQDIPLLLRLGKPNDVLAIGENISALVLSELLLSKGVAAVKLDARDFLYFNNYQFEFVYSQQKLIAHIQPDTIHIVTGYIAKDMANNTITLGRNGSDYSATLVGSLIKANSISIWTDVPAIYSADPRYFTHAQPYVAVNWQQACLLAQLGNPVLHPRTLYPLQQGKASLLVKSSFNSQKRGSAVVLNAKSQDFLTTIPQAQLVSVPINDPLCIDTVAQQIQVPLSLFDQTKEQQRWLVPLAAITLLLEYLAKKMLKATLDPQLYFAIAWLKAEHTSGQCDADRILEPNRVQHRTENDEKIIWLLAEPLANEELNKLHDTILNKAILHTTLL